MIDQIEALEQEYIHCSNMCYHLWIARCKLMEFYTPDNEPIIRITDALEATRLAYAYKINEIRDRLIALGWN